MNEKDALHHGTDSALTTKWSHVRAHTRHLLPPRRASPSPPGTHDIQRLGSKRRDATLVVGQAIPLPSGARALIELSWPAA